MIINQKTKNNKTILTVTHTLQTSITTMLVMSHNYPIKVYNKSAYILKYDTKNSTVRGEIYFSFCVAKVHTKKLLILKNIHFIDGLIFSVIHQPKIA